MGKFLPRLTASRAAVFAAVLALPLVGTALAGAQTTTPSSVSDYVTAAVGMFTSHAGEIGLGLITLGGATVILAIGVRFIRKAWHALSGLGRSGV